MSELHQMSVHALTEKLEKAEKELAVAVIENADLREGLSSLESLYRARDKDCAAKEEELERLRKDAERYRWLRSVPSGSEAQRIVNNTPEGMDAAIDAAMEKENKA